MPDYPNIQAETMGFPVKLNGNMLVVQEQLHPFILGKLLLQTWPIMMVIILMAKGHKVSIEGQQLLWVVLKWPMLLAYTICTEMFTNGAKMIGMIIMRVHPMMVVHGYQAIKILQKELQKYFGAAPGSSILGGVALRSASSITPTRRTTTLLVFVL